MLSQYILALIASALINCPDLDLAKHVKSISCFECLKSKFVYYTHTSA